MILLYHLETEVHLQSDGCSIMIHGWSWKLTIEMIGRAKQQPPTFAQRDISAWENQSKVSSGQVSRVNFFSFSWHWGLTLLYTVSQYLIRYSTTFDNYSEHLIFSHRNIRRLYIRFYLCRNEETKSETTQIQLFACHSWMISDVLTSAKRLVASDIIVSVTPLFI